MPVQPDKKTYTASQTLSEVFAGEETRVLDTEKLSAGKREKSCDSPIQASLFSGRPLQIRPDFSHYLCTPERRADYYRPASRPEIPFGSHDSGGFVNDLYRYF